MRGSDLAKLPALDRTQIPCGNFCFELARLSASGVVLLGFSCPHAPGFERASLSTAFDWEAASVTSRVGFWLRPLPSVSALLCTSRPDFLAAAAAQITVQDYPSLELVVVTHGFDEASARKEMFHIQTAGIPVKVIEVPSSVSFGQALTLGAQACEGDLVTKVDDDDYYSSSHVSDLVAAWNYSSAELVGKALQYVYLEDIDTSVRLNPSSSVAQPEVFSTWVCGGTIMLARELGRDINWFDSLPRAVDRNIQDKVLSRSGKIYRTHGLGYLYARRSAGHTYVTDWSKYLKVAIEQRFGLWASFEAAPLVTTYPGAAA